MCFVLGVLGGVVGKGIKCINYSNISFQIVLFLITFVSIIITLKKK